MKSFWLKFCFLVTYIDSLQKARFTIHKQVLYRKLNTDKGFDMSSEYILTIADNPYLMFC